MERGGCEHMRNYPRASADTEIDASWTIEVILPKNGKAVRRQPETRITILEFAKAVAAESGFKPLSSLEPIIFLGADPLAKWAQVRIN